MQIFSNIKFTGRMGYLAISGIISINKKIKAGIYTFKIYINLFVLKIHQVKLPIIETTGILIRNIGKIKWNRITYINILMIVITIHLPTGRNSDTIFT